jgi:hypothetical protein
MTTTILPTPVAAPAPQGITRVSRVKAARVADPTVVRAAARTAVRVAARTVEGEERRAPVRAEATPGKPAKPVRVVSAGQGKVASAVRVERRERVVGMEEEVAATPTVSSTTAAAIRS